MNNYIVYILLILFFIFTLFKIMGIMSNIIDLTLIGLFWIIIYPALMCYKVLTKRR